MTIASAAANANVAVFQNLLRELFQFDCAELDFGIYRIMNHKREVVERFITENLPATIAAELDSGPLAQQTQANAALETARQNVVATLGDPAIGDDGQLDDAFRSVPVGQAYLQAQARAADGGRNRDAIEAAIYNYLYTFFSRYYDEGDFISQRRYSGNQRYAIPYNGEEVYLHWANNDQYYVKTDEYFRNYDWQAPNGVTVRFRLRNADVEQNNVKGVKRFFLPVVSEVEWDADVHAVTIPVNYRALNKDEADRHGDRDQQRKINEATASEILLQMIKSPEALAALTSERHRNGSGPISYLLYHLRRYTTRNNSDFFIHKDLCGFLNRELDFYLKNEVLNLQNLTAAGQDMAETWFQELRLIKAAGGQIIEFLTQIEDFQKLLWEKRKFVTETQYCIILDMISADFYPDIIANDAQWKEWRDLFSVDDKERSEAYLQAHPTLVLDTKHFDADFTDRLLATIDDLNGKTDGLLVHSESWQALGLLQEKYVGTVKCIYIDPLYNTGQDGFMYKDNYQHSTWLAMMDNLIPHWRSLLTESGSLVSHIDEHEFNRLDQLISMRFGADQNVGPIVWDKRNPKGDATAIASQHEYLCWAVKDYSALKGNKRRLSRRKENAEAIINKANELIALNDGVSDTVRDKFKSWVAKQDFSGGEKAYSNLDDSGAVYRPVSMAWPNTQQAPAEYFVPLIHPVTGKPCPVPARGWRNPPPTMASLLEQDLILFGPDETTQPARKYLLQDNMSENVPSLYYYGGSDANLQKDFGYSFDNPKPLRLSEYVIAIAASDSRSLVMDCFAGSGTTGHAVINLNRDDGVERKFILVEMGEYFGTVLLPRIKKVTFSPEWKDGKPQRQATAEETAKSPRVMKYLRLESYEDALDSIVFGEKAGQPPLLESSDEYLLKYLLRWETKDSETLLNVAKLTDPFNYRLRVHVNGVRKERAVDLPETFNYLIGLNVRTRIAYDDGGCRYLVYRGETRANPRETVVVIWRATNGWTEPDFARDRDFVVAKKLADGAETVYVNGDSGIPSAKPIEPIFKVRMFASVNA